MWKITVGLVAQQLALQPQGGSPPAKPVRGHQQPESPGHAPVCLLWPSALHEVTHRGLRGLKWGPLGARQRESCVLLHISALLGESFPQCRQL